MKEIYAWISGELLDLNALAEAVQGRETLISTMQKKEKAKASGKKDLDSLAEGKATFKTLFKS